MPKVRSVQNTGSRSTRPIETVWEQYKDNPTEDLRNELIEHYLPLVKYIAERIHTRLPAEVDVEDLVSYGVFGLMDAIKSFRPDLGFKFETFCAQRIRGSILDWLRSMDWIPRLVHSRTKKIESTRQRIQKETGRNPADEEIAGRLKLNGEDYSKIIKDGRIATMVSLSRQRFETDSNKDVREIDVLEDVRQDNPFDVVQRHDLKDLITRDLTRAERLIVILYYYEQLTMKEIGVTLDLSESRVSQMHSSILQRLKAQLHNRGRELACKVG
ncbi:MAG: FliA/WhiG family RNA polymerase sigma factor [Phycisphaeraceae bacterium]|nr:FliA/WhiG family RNA polymerase sigma factor [Phycisphaeraceae bacterium]